MRPELLTPEGTLDPEMLRNVFALIGVTVDQEALEPWTDLELVLAYDWAVREHLHASDNPVQRRPRPSFVEAAEKAAVREELAAEGPRIHQALREFLCMRGQPGASERLIMANLAARDMYPAPEVLERWLEADERDELVEKNERGRWRATSKMEPMLCLSKRFPPDGGAAHHWDQLIASLEGSQQPIDQRLSIVIGTAQKAIAELRARIAQAGS